MSRDRERLGLAIDALLENAVQHTEPGDFIRLSVIRDDRAGTARLVVQDAGTGIPPAELGAHLRPVRDRTGEPRATAAPGSAWRSSVPSPGATAARCRAQSTAGPRQQVRDHPAVAATASCRSPAAEAARAGRRSRATRAGAACADSGDDESRPGCAGRSRRSRVRMISYAVAAVIVLAAQSCRGVAGRAQHRKPAAPPPLARSFSLAELGHPGPALRWPAIAGHPVIINFFASWCAPCQRETPMLARFYLASTAGCGDRRRRQRRDGRRAAVRARKSGVRYPVAFDPFPSPTTTSYGVLRASADLLPQCPAPHRASTSSGQLTVKDLARGSRSWTRIEAETGVVHHLDTKPPRATVRRSGWPVRRTPRWVLLALAGVPGRRRRGRARAQAVAGRARHRHARLPAEMSPPTSSPARPASASR